VPDFAWRSLLAVGKKHGESEATAFIKLPNWIPREKNKFVILPKISFDLEIFRKRLDKAAEKVYNLCS
jgi:hypothetical protein